MKEGKSCQCLEEIDHDNFELLPVGKCNIPCGDDSDYVCGGQEHYSIYVAGIVDTIIDNQ